MCEQYNEIILNILDNLKTGKSNTFLGENYPAIAFIDSSVLFELFEFLLNEETFIQYLFFIDTSLTQREFNLKSKEEIKSELMYMFSKNIICKLRFIHIVFLYLRTKCIEEKDKFSKEIKNAIEILKNMRWNNDWEDY